MEERRELRNVFSFMFLNFEAEDNPCNYVKKLTP